MKIYFLFVILFLTSSLIASDIEVKTELSEIDCSLSQSIVYIDILIKRADSRSGDIFLENQNYRFSINSKTLKFGTFFIHSEGEISGFTNYADGSYSLFSEHDLNGSTEHIISYNIDYLGGTSGYRLKDEWTKVGTIGATLLTNKECSSTSLLTDSDFPSTVLIITKDNKIKEIDKKPTVYNTEYCVSNHCNRCLPYLSLNSIDQNYTLGELFEHKVSGYIEADNRISQQSDIIYNVTDYGLLKPGFEVSTNSTFEVKVEGCQ